MKVGDTVQLRPAVLGRRKGKKQIATIQRTREDGGVLLDKRLCDFSWWHKDDLEIVDPERSSKT